MHLMTLRLHVHLMLLGEDRAHLIVAIGPGRSSILVLAHPEVAVDHVEILLRHVIAPLLEVLMHIHLSCVTSSVAPLLVVLLGKQELALRALFTLSHAAGAHILALSWHVGSSSGETVGELASHVARILLEGTAAGARSERLLLIRVWQVWHRGLGAHLGHARITHRYMRCRGLMAAIHLHRHSLLLVILRMQNCLHLQYQILNHLGLVHVALRHLHVLNLLQQVLEDLVALLVGSDSLLVYLLGLVLLLLHHEHLLQVADEMLRLLLLHCPLLGRLLISLHLLLENHLELVNLLDFLDTLLHVSDALQLLLLAAHGGVTWRASCVKYRLLLTLTL